MAAELKQPNAIISTVPPTRSTATPSPDPPPLDDPVATNPPKRQRRPSVRLGEIGGDSPHDSHDRRPNKTWRFHRDPFLAAKTSQTRPLTNLVNGEGGGINFRFHDSIEAAENCVDLTYRKAKIKKPTKRARTNWNKFESSTTSNGVGGGGGGVGISESTDAFQDQNEECREFEPELSDSPLLKEQQSPVNSVGKMGFQLWDQRRMENGTLVPECNEGIVGVREWLIGLGLGRYTPVFEIREIDDEVLPMLTLDDLKDMGISAVGSRRKIYTAILKLRSKELS